MMSAYPLWPRGTTRAALLISIALVAACTRPRLVVPSPTRAPSPAPTTASPAPEAARTTALPVEGDFAYLRERRLLVPVAGIASDQIVDSFNDPRDGHRRHHAIDILAPRGTPVLAADDGRILRVSWNSAGGNTIYATDSDGRVVYYYAHLDHYRESLGAGTPLVKGDTIGFVGTTGNAPKGIPHLHFQIMRMPANGKYWTGDAINPFPLLREDVLRTGASARP